MSEGLMSGMFWGGVLLSSVPISLGIGIGIYVLRRYLAERAPAPGAAAPGIESEAP
ncbi:MAG TPA: hypothetical protein VMK65_12670 [Longimicrobiales bacterium]|nr:hypothetical protein [Longimicrobiales bacterium]